MLLRFVAAGFLYAFVVVFVTQLFMPLRLVVPFAFVALFLWPAQHHLHKPTAKHRPSPTAHRPSPINWAMEHSLLLFYWGGPSFRLSRAL